ASQTELVEELFPGFSAPEQYSTVSPHGPWTDVYAVCALLYNCVTAQPPTEALVRSTSKPLMSPRERNETVPPRVSQAIMQGLSLSTTDRIQNIGELLKRIGGPFQSTAAGNDAPTVSIASMKAQSAVLRMTETFDKSEEEDVDPAKPRSKRLVLWSMGVTLPILLAILIFTFWFLFGKSRDPQPPEDSSSIVDSMFGDFSDASSNRYESSSGDSFDSSTDPSDSSNEEEKSQMDSLVGMSYEAVVANAGYREKYIFNPPQYAYNEQYEAGVIFEQNIESGALVEKNASIQLKVSKGSAYVMIPSYEKMTETDYVAKLRQLGINCTVIYRSDEIY
ncbi:MAG: PASTA domain-containing protein, partial [Oscillospiraceae bacterium]